MSESTFLAVDKVACGVRFVFPLHLGVLTGLGSSGRLESFSKERKGGHGEIDNR